MYEEDTRENFSLLHNTVNGGVAGYQKSTQVKKQLEKYTEKTHQGPLNKRSTFSLVVV